MIYKLYVQDNGNWLDTCERGTKEDLLKIMAECPSLYQGVEYRFKKCRDQSPIDGAVEIMNLLNGYVRI